MKHISNVTVAKAQVEDEATNVFDFIVRLLSGTPVLGGANIFDVIATLIGK